MQNEILLETFLGLENYAKIDTEEIGAGFYQRSSIPLTKAQHSKTNPNEKLNNHESSSNSSPSPRWQGLDCASVSSTILGDTWDTIQQGFFLAKFGQKPTHFEFDPRFLKSDPKKAHTFFSKFKNAFYRQMFENSRKNAIKTAVFQKFRAPAQNILVNFGSFSQFSGFFKWWGPNHEISATEIGREPTAKEIKRNLRPTSKKVAKNENLLQKRLFFKNFALETEINIFSVIIAHF